MRTLAARCGGRPATQPKPMPANANHHGRGTVVANAATAAMPQKAVTASFRGILRDGGMASGAWLTRW